MRARLSLTAALVVLGALLLAPAANAAEAAPMTEVVKVTGAAEGGKRFTGKYTIDRFTRAKSGRYAGKLVSVGTLRGRLGGKRVTERRVVMPARLSRAAQGAQLPPIPGACDILNLVLGPIHLDLLGLVVRTNRINLRIDAVPGEGNLLGNLLCAITGLLDPQGASAGQLGQALNAILALVPRQ